MKNTNQFIAIFLFFAVLALACGTSTVEPPRPTSTPEPTRRVPSPTAQGNIEDDDSAAQVAAPQEDNPVQTPTPTTTQTARPSSTPQPTETATIPASDTPPPTETPTPTPVPCQNDSALIEHVSIPDGTAVEPGRNFVKTWRVRNAGTCPWTTGYRLRFLSGERMGAAESIPLTQDVEPGDTVNVSIPFTAPTATGSHTTRWQMQAADDAMFGDVLATQIVVSDLLSTLHGELFFSSGGGFPTSCSGIFQSEYPSTRPNFLLGEVFGNFANFCLFGLPLDETIDLALYDPARQFLGSLTFQAEENPNSAFAPYELISSAGDWVGMAWEIDGVTVMEVEIWMSGATPFGEWYAVADSGTTHREGTVVVDPQYPDWFAVGPQQGYDPFGGAAPLRAGDIVVVTGSGFDPGQIVPLGVYYLSGETGTLVYSQLVTIGSNGRFSLGLRIEDSDPAGEYQVILGTDQISSGDDPATSYHSGHTFRVQ